MNNYYEEKRPTTGANFQVHIQQTKDGDTLFTRPHIHDFIEMLYCIDGIYKITINNYETTFSKGEAVIIGSRKIHTIRPLLDPNGKYLVVKFQPEMIYSSHSSLIELKYISPFIFTSSVADIVYDKNTVEQSGLDISFKNILKEISLQSYGYEIAVKAEIYKIILWIIRTFKENDGILKGYTEATLNKIEKALEYIEENYNKNINVCELAESIHIDYCYFSRIFKQITGTNCCAYINHLRVKKAEILLLSKNMNITEIGERVGFDSTSYFIKQFKKFKGLSPKQYQKMILKSSE